MSDCANAEIRDRLPDLLHDRLDASARAVVTAHVATCVECHDELELLRGMHGMLIARSPRIDVAAVVAALPAPPRRDVRPIRPRRTWTDWRIAAALTFLVAGGSSVALYRHAGVQTAVVAETPSIDVPTQSPANNAVVPIATQVTSAKPAVTKPETLALASSDEGGPAVASAAADLNDRQLQALLDDINRLEAVPITDPDPVSIKVTPRTPAPTSVTSGRGTE
jgi:anti-sigma factor RsiW